MDNQPPVLKIQGDRLQLANKALIGGFGVSVVALIGQIWLDFFQYALYISLPVTITAGMYELYVRYKMQLVKEERAPDWQKVKIQKEVPMELGGNSQDPPNVTMPQA